MRRFRWEGGILNITCNLLREKRQNAFFATWMAKKSYFGPEPMTTLYFVSLLGETGCRKR